MSPLFCLYCREEDLVERRLDATCVFCWGPACSQCDACPGCDRIIHPACPVYGEWIFPGDTVAHPQFREEEELV